MKQLFTQKKTIVSLILFLVFNNSFAQLSIVSNQNIDFSTAVTTIKSGNWSDTTVWSNGQVPNANTDVIINNNHTVYIDIQGSVSDQIIFYYFLEKGWKVEQTLMLEHAQHTSIPNRNSFER